MPKQYAIIFLGIVLLAISFWFWWTKEQRAFVESTSRSATSVELISPSAQSAEGDSEIITQGKRLFEEEDCLSCHSIYGQGGKVGPDLAYVGRRKPVDWIMQHIKDPQSASPGTVMPKFGFLDEEVKAITVFLLRQAERSSYFYAWMPKRLTSPERGRILFQKYGCALCHGIQGTGGVRNNNALTGDAVTSLTYVARAFNRESLRQKILTGVLIVAKKDSLGPVPPLFMPSFRGRITDSELDDLITYLLSLAPQEEEE